MPVFVSCRLGQTLKVGGKTLLAWAWPGGEVAGPRRRFITSSDTVALAAHGKSAHFSGSRLKPPAAFADNRKMLFRTKRLLLPEGKPSLRKTCHQRVDPGVDIADNKAFPPLEPPARSDLEQAPQYQAQIERTGVNQNPLLDVIPPS
jgi:hypothetical protein